MRKTDGVLFQCKERVTEGSSPKVVSNAKIKTSNLKFTYYRQIVIASGIASFPQP